MNEIRVLLVDDHLGLRTQVRQLIESQNDLLLVAEAGSVREAVRLAVEEAVTVVVMDLSLPDGNGITATAEIMQQRPELRVLGSSRHEDVEYMEKMLAVGACGYVLKSTIAEHLLTAIRTVAAGEMYIDPTFESSQQKPQSLHHDTTHEAVHRRAAVIDELHADEVAVLKRVAWGDSNGEIAQHLGMLVPTVTEHKARAMQKLGLRTRIDVIRYSEAQRWKREESGDM